jgi:hypothetical protein
MSKNPTLVSQQKKLPWEKVLGVLNKYLDGVKVLFEKSDMLVNPERRIQGKKIDDRVIELVHPPCISTNNNRLQKNYNEKRDFNWQETHCWKQCF